MRTLTHMTRMLAAAASFALPAVAAAQGNTGPIVAVFPFENNAIGGTAAEFNGMSKGVQDLVITEMASNGKIRLVDREKIQAVLQEQGLIKQGAIDPATAVRLGKILGVQYVITGGFMTDGKTAAILTGRTIDMETTQIGNAQKIQGKTDNVLDLISQLASKLNTDIKLDAKPGRRVGDAGAAAPAATPAAAPAQTGSPAKAADKPASKPAEAIETYAYAKPMPTKARAVKLDIKTAQIYSNALDEMDKKNKTKAIALFAQVVKAFPEFTPASEKLDRLQKAGD